MIEDLLKLPQKVKVSVTKFNIKKGLELYDDKDKRADVCPIAQACKRVPSLKLYKVAVHATWVEVSSKDERYRVCYVLPDEVSDVIDKYDDTGKMEPLTFTMDLDNPIHNRSRNPN